jgi:hypothetical protein
MNPADNQLRLAIILLWTGIVLGAVNLGAHAWLIWQATGQADAVSPIILTTALFIFVQARLVLKLHSGNGAVRNRLLMITLLRIVLLVPNFERMIAIAPALAILPLIAALLQLTALGLLYLSPARHRFSTPVPVRP